MSGKKYFTPVYPFVDLTLDRMHCHFDILSAIYITVSEVQPSQCQLHLPPNALWTVNNSTASGNYGNLSPQLKECGV